MSQQSDEAQVNEEEIAWVSSDEKEEKKDAQYDDDVRSIDLEETDDEDEYAEYEGHDEEIIDVAKADVEKTEEVKGDNDQAEIEAANVDQATDTSSQGNQATALVFVMSHPQTGPQRNTCLGRAVIIYIARDQVNDHYMDV
nr:hypothetical protein [Tanacetum cinerariifolium]